MQIRRAGEKDLEGVHNLLSQVLEVHAAGRPDIPTAFSGSMITRPSSRRYTAPPPAAMQGASWQWSHRVGM